MSKVIGAAGTLRSVATLTVPRPPCFNKTSAISSPS